MPHGYPLVTYSHVELANGTTCSGTEPHACDSGIQGFRGIGQNMCLESRFSTCAIWCFMGPKTGCPLSSATVSACSATGSAPRRHVMCRDIVDVCLDTLQLIFQTDTPNNRPKPLVIATDARQRSSITHTAPVKSQSTQNDLYAIFSGCTVPA